MSNEFGMRFRFLDPTEACRCARREDRVERDNIRNREEIVHGRREEARGGDISVWGDQ